MGQSAPPKQHRDLDNYTHQGYVPEDPFYWGWLFRHKIPRYGEVNHPILPADDNGLFQSLAHQKDYLEWRFKERKVLDAETMLDEEALQWCQRRERPMHLKYCHLFYDKHFAITRKPCRQELIAKLDWGLPIVPNPIATPATLGDAPHTPL
eukprot:TRINITY_DN2929_c0_g1_i1.p2 TRINITY_DN2929_c0_g1~~TRINITY_DN2929_c0_g1_i1.p2  ORF type:complete len:159 (+),score=34.59 TRINITY_DN2929_c0_g1_i1:26-478(+)